MTDNTDSEDSRIDRRTVLKASSASIAGAAISTPVSADSNEDDRNTANRDSPYQPDVRIIDNSSDDKPIDVSYRRVTEEADADKQQPDTDTQQVGTDDREIDSITVNTVGINSQQLQEELDAAVANADTDGDNIGTESTDKIDPSAILQDAKAEIERIEIPHNEQIELVAMYGDDSDSTRINVGERGAATEETALVTVDPDGSVSVNLDIACH